MWPLKSILYFAFFWVACLVSLVNPIWGVINYLMVYQTNPTVTWWGEPLQAIGMRFSFLAAVFTILGLFFGRKRVPASKPWLSGWEIGLLVLMLIALINILLGVTYDHRSRNWIEKLWKMMVFVMILARMGSSRANLRLIIWAFVVGTLYVGYDAFTANPKAFLFGRLNRIGGPDFATSSGTAAYLSAMLPIIGTAFLIAGSWKLRALAAVAGALAVNGVVLCRTRSAFIGLLAGFLVAILLAPRARRYRIHILLVAGSILAFTLTDNHYWDRMETLTDREALRTDMAAASRTDIWKVSLDILADHPFGIGVGNFARVIGRYDARYAKRSTHNTVVVCFVEFGVQGGMIFLAMALTSLWYLYESSRIAEATDHPLETKFLAYGLLVAFVTYFVTGLGTERFYCESYWWIFALPLCLYRTALAEANTISVPLEPDAAAEAVEDYELAGELLIHEPCSSGGNTYRSFA